MKRKELTSPTSRNKGNQSLDREEILYLGGVCHDVMCPNVLPPRCELAVGVSYFSGYKYG